MDQNPYRIKTAEVFFLIAGLGILFSLPWLEGVGFNLWLAAQIAYGIGVILFVINTYRELKK